MGQDHPHGSMRKGDRSILHIVQISAMPFFAMLFFCKKKGDPARAIYGFCISRMTLGTSLCKMYVFEAETKYRTIGTVQCVNW